MRSQIPIIMIGPGTGLAPFRGFIQERHLAKKEDKQLGDTILYFGCRHKDQDFLYREVIFYIFLSKYMYVCSQEFS